MRNARPRRELMGAVLELLAIDVVEQRASEQRPDNQAGAR